MNTAVAKIGTFDYHILGLLPKSEELSSEFLWVDNIRIPEEVQLILALPNARTLPNSFEFLLVAPKSEPLPPNARILNYSFPRLRSSNSFFNPINSHLLAVPFLSIYSNCTSYLGLGLLPNAHPLSLALSLQHVQPAPPAQPITPPSPTAPPPYPSGNVSAPTRSLEQLQDNFRITGIERAKILLGKQYPLLVTSKSMTPHPNYIPYNLTLPHHEETHKLLNDFQIVAKMDEDPWVPPNFYPLVLVPIQIGDLSDNEIKLHMFINITEGEEVNEKKNFQVVMLRNPFQKYTPAYPYYIMCIVPKNQPESSLSSDLIGYNPTTQPTFIPHIPAIATTMTSNDKQTKFTTVGTDGTESAHVNQRESKPLSANTIVKSLMFG